MWVRGHVSTWTCEYMDMWVCGHVSTWTCEYVDASVVLYKENTRHSHVRRGDTMSTTIMSSFHVTNNSVITLISYKSITVYSSSAYWIDHQLLHIKIDSRTGLFLWRVHTILWDYYTFHCRTLQHTPIVTSSESLYLTSPEALHLTKTDDSRTWRHRFTRCIVNLYHYSLWMKTHWACWTGEG